MTLAALADLADVVGALGVVAGLVFVGIQMRQQTKQMRRAEANAAMAQASALRHALFADPGLASALVSWLGTAPLDAAGELRMRTFFNEAAFLGSQVWHRVQDGLVNEDEFRRTVIPWLTTLLMSPRGMAWWRANKSSYRLGFIAEVEAAIPALRSAASIAPTAPSATVSQPAETAVAPPADTS